MKKTARRTSASITHPFFRGISAPFKKILMRYASTCRVAKGAHIFQNGEKADRFFLILKGKVSILAEEQDVRFDPEASMGVLQVLGPGEVVGWSWLIPPYRWRFYAVADTDTWLLAFDGVGLRREISKNHDFGYEIYRRLVPVMNHRLNASRLKLQMFGARPFAVAEGG